jgi:hypothetical protein
MEDTPDNSGDDIDKIIVKTGAITFLNESSYSVTIHQGVFTGPVLFSLSAGQSKKADVRISDNYGIGSTFCIEYAYKVIDGTDLASGEVWANGIDPNVQINLVVEADKSYSIQIPQPAALNFPMAFIKIVNASNTHFELAYFGTSFKQTGNGVLPVPSGQTGVYQIESSADGKEITGYKVISVFTPCSVPDFTAKDSYIYNFIFDGASVTAHGQPQKIIF